MKIYTGTGDEGTTGLFGGPRVSKSDLRIECYGTVDELNAVLGLARAALGHDGASSMDPSLAKIQSDLLVLGADLATPSGSRAEVQRIDAGYAAWLEEKIDEMEAELTPLTRFILPGGSAAGSALHVARTICRRAERHAVRLKEGGVEASEVLVYLNRLSDFLFVAARWVNHREGAPEKTWSGS